MNHTDIVNYAGKTVPCLRFPDGTKIELTPAEITVDPHKTCVNLERWLRQWSDLQKSELESRLTGHPE